MQTKGEYLVGVSHNPSGEGSVDQIKQKAAELIDLIEKATEMKAVSTSAQAEQQAQIYRCKNVAIEHVEDAVHWAVKAVTKPERK